MPVIPGQPLPRGDAYRALPADERTARAQIAARTRWARIRDKQAAAAWRGVEQARADLARLLAAQDAA